MVAAVAAVEGIVRKQLEAPVEVALIDAVRILDWLCTIDRSLVCQPLYDDARA